MDSGHPYTSSPVGNLRAADSMAPTRHVVPRRSACRFVALSLRLRLAWGPEG